ncbi:hypothetical protein L0665_09920 [Methanogenium marinum]|uniref:Uncharacterized protein n=1 Tax=Methanogenium marinum TaxID=348610 RepID=A0A9Q4PYX7_9EURY|nr:hypothetical protein [Methanogenium marinum]MDE4908922.1 hypothetical protein [Methanogenium marinum]
MKEGEMGEGRSASVCRKNQIRGIISALMPVFCLLVVLSCGCLDAFWNISTGLEDGDSPSPVSSEGARSSLVSNESVETSSARGVMPEDADGVGGTGGGVTDESGELMNPVSPDSFSLTYAPADGYQAEEGELLEMQVRVVPGEEFSAPVSLRLDIAVPSPGLPFITLWEGSFDLGTTSPPYRPVTLSLPLDPNSPPEEFEWVTGVARQAKTLGIASFSVNVRITAEGGGQIVSESPSYTVRLS